MGLAAVVWLGALLGPFAPLSVGIFVAVLGLLGAAGSGQRVVLIVVFLGVGLASGSASSAREEATLTADLPSGRGTLSGWAVSDPLPYGDRFRFVLAPTSWAKGPTTHPWQGPPVAVISEEETAVAGDAVAVSGRLREDPDRVRGDPVAGRITADEVTILGDSPSPLFVAGNAVRDRVADRLGVLGPTAEAALLSGFLIGDVTDLPETDTEALRRAGLTHYVAVSGSNVALVLGAWWLVLGPTGAGTRIRAATGLVVLAVFVVVTRWESSVIRAATMAALVLGGRAVGAALDAWMALGSAVIILIGFSGDLAYDVGFQLSVAATSGVLVGMRIFADRRPRVLWGLLAATISAQAAVVPLLLLHFGEVPLLSPLANVIAAPLVTVSTAAAGLGVIVPWDLPLMVAERAAGVVLDVAAIASGWPQLGVMSVLTLGGVLGLVWRTRLRWGVVGGALLIAVAGMVPAGVPDVPTVVFLDVGQGDSVLLRDPSGAVVLMDGGREPVILHEALREQGVGRIDLLVASHGDADHVGGFEGLLDRVAVRRIWIPSFADTSGILDGVLDDAAVAGVPVDEVAMGAQAYLGEFSLEVLGPMRRYAADNDGSVVLMVEADSVSLLLPGDIGAIAQRSLPAVAPDILMVPHHGAATSDLDWLAATVGQVAVVSVGPNTYGHPAPEIVAVLEESGAQVFTTWDLGAVIIPMG